MGMAGHSPAGSHASVHFVGSQGPRGPQTPLRSGVKPRQCLGLFLVKRTHVESQILLPRGYDPRYCLLTCLLLLGDSEHPLGWAHRPPQAGAPGSLKKMAALGLAGDSEHPPGRTPCPPQAGAPGSLKKMAPHWPGSRLRTPPGQDSPSPPGRCARFSKEDGPPLAWQQTPNTSWAGLPVPPGPVRPVL